MKKPKKLQQRITLFILLPVFLILAGLGWASFLYTRDAILAQWGETAIAKLQRAAHLIDMRLSRPKRLLLMLEDAYSQDKSSEIQKDLSNQTAAERALDTYSQGQNLAIQKFIVEQLREMDGVVEVNSSLIKNVDKKAGHMGMHMGMHMMMNKKPMHASMMGSFQLSLPHYNTRLKGETISLSRELKDQNGDKIVTIEVVMSFQDLIDQISRTTWWKSNKAFLIDTKGNILTGTNTKKNKNDDQKPYRFAASDPLEKETIAALKKNPYGTLFSPGHPPKEISGYCRLKEAPWSLVLISPGNRVLKSVLNFRLYYSIVGFLSILSVLFFIRISISGTINAIKKVSMAAEELANGIFGEQLTVLSKDEVGELTRNFNKMTLQLKERMDLKEAMNIAMEVQQSLLPPTSLSYENIEISGRSVYCDKTGGDYFDIIRFPDDPGKICMAVGDVVGHGIGAALLMATTRALLRSRVTQKGSLSEIMNDVNRMLCLDTVNSGSFVTLFVLIVDVNNGELQWVRAGHEPAMVHHPGKKEILELKGDGLVLGLDECWNYTENVYSHLEKGTVILIGTDGTWDVENKSGERFGKKRVEKVLENSDLLSPEQIVDSIISQTQIFREKIRQNDDITLLSLKFL